MKRWLILAAMCLCFAGCDDGSGTRGGITDDTPFYGLTSIGEVIEYLADPGQGGTDPDNPVELSVRVSASEWERLFETIQLADKFVALDISRCYNVPREFNISFYMILIWDYKIVSMILPMGITSIVNNHLVYYPNLRQITLPASLTSIGYSAFSNNENLARVICHATTPPVMRDWAFQSVSADLVIEVPAASVAAYKAAENWSEYADKIRAM